MESSQISSSLNKLALHRLAKSLSRQIKTPTGFRDGRTTICAIVVVDKANNNSKGI
jgi:hypothetical protein